MLYIRVLMILVCFLLKSILLVRDLSTLRRYEFFLFYRTHISGQYCYQLPNLTEKLFVLV